MMPQRDLAHPGDPSELGRTPAADAADGWTVHTDGTAWPNPGRMGLGAVLVAPDGRRLTLSIAAPQSGCNNEAELRAVMAALALARAEGAEVVRLHCDNSIVVAELAGTAPRPMARLHGLFDEARVLAASFRRLELVWIPRHRNAEADVLARAAVGLAPKLAKASRRKR